ncbi:hypothetical protein CCACVL1_20363 [Corchorus capsularis]|uniref:Uncharacterized protein n=1 Tax=Corchorus capsularis TaxID=210143 RepID=A0A1R3HBK7_COCAP|nr:hypothetical protein CCACVL1_20363 [Corchorus capsularis]
MAPSQLGSFSLSPNLILVFFKREFSRTWPFLVGFAITGTIVTKFSLGLTEEDAKNSPFVQRHKR